MACTELAAKDTRPGRNEPVESTLTSFDGSDVALSDYNIDSVTSTIAPFPVAEDGVKIICVGLMRTGLHSLRRALKELGYSRFYDQEDIASTYTMWERLMRNKADNDIFPSIFQGAQVVMGVPTFCFWEQILERYPNARVILTVRSEDEWWRSVSRAKALMDASLPLAPMRYGSSMRRFEKFFVPSYHRFCEVLRFAWATTLGAHALEGEAMNEVAARNNFRRHNSYVKLTLSGKRLANGQRQLLVYDASDGWKPLCKFLGQQVPCVDFPAVMDVPYLFEQQSRCKGYADLKTWTEDCDQDIEELLVPDSQFGMRMRAELRVGLAKYVGAFTCLLGAVAVLNPQVHVSVVALAYLAIIVACWNAYVVMHGLVMRVPALVVLPMTMKSLLIAVCLQGCFITYGILKEQLVTQDEIASPVLILSSRLMSVLCGGSALLLTQGNLSLEGMSLLSFSAFGVTNEVSTLAGYEMLKYVSFPVQVMAKSCKLLPNMIMDRALGGTKYPLSGYLQAICAMFCVALMHFTDESDYKRRNRGSRSDGDISESWRMLIGLMLLTIFFACDSCTSQWQTSIYKESPKITQTQMMVAGNVVGCCITMGTIAIRWGLVSRSILLAMENPNILGRIFLLGLSGAMGQFCIYTAIKVLGPISFTWIMTSRQLFSVLISLVLFGHGVSFMKLACIVTVFAIMSAKQLTRTVPRALRMCSKWKGRSPSKRKGS